MEQTSSSAATSLPKMKFRRIHRHKAAKARASVLKSRVSELESKPATSQEHTGDSTARHWSDQDRTRTGRTSRAHGPTATAHSNAAWHLFSAWTTTTTTALPLEALKQSNCHPRMAGKCCAAGSVGHEV